MKRTRAPDNGHDCGSNNIDNKNKRNIGDPANKAGRPGRFTLLFDLQRQAFKENSKEDHPKFTL